MSAGVAHDTGGSLDSTFSVMTYNVWNFQRGHHWHVRAKLITGIISRLDPDVVAVQELRDDWRDELPNQVEDLAKLLPQYPHWYYHPSMTFRWADEGIAIFSKYAFNHSYCNLSISEMDHNQRIVLQASIPFVKGKLHLFNTHWSFDRDVQPAQADEACTFANTFHSDLQIFMGDLNLYSDFPYPVIRFVSKYPMIMLLSVV